MTHAKAQIPVRLGILLNPRARDTQLLRKQSSKLPAGVVMYASSHLHEVPRLLEKLLWEDKVSVLGICGGDGTIHHTLHALLQLWQEKEAPLPTLPPILLLRGGTMNIFARAMGLEGSPQKLLSHFWQRYGHTSLASLPLLSQPLLRVESEHYGVRFGSVFGSALTARALQVYEEQVGGGYKGLALFLKEAVTGVLLKTSLWQENADLLEGPAAWLTLDGEDRPYRAVVASTVDIMIMGGWIKGMRVMHGGPGKMQVRLLGDVEPLGLLRRLPHLVLGWKAEEILDRPASRSIQLSGDFSLDGEVFRQSPEARIEVQATHWALSMVNLSHR